MVMGQLSDSGARALNELESALPVEDLLAWLIGKMPGADDQALFAALRAAYLRGWHIEPGSADMLDYEVGERTIQACAQRVYRDRQQAEERSSQ